MCIAITCDGLHWAAAPDRSGSFIALPTSFVPPRQSVSLPKTAEVQSGSGNCLFFRASRATVELIVETCQKFTQSSTSSGSHTGLRNKNNHRNMPYLAHLQRRGKWGRTNSLTLQGPGSASANWIFEAFNGVFISFGFVAFRVFDNSCRWRTRRALCPSVRGRYRSRGLATSEL